MRLRYAFFIVLAALLLSSCNFSLAADITPPPDYVPPSPMPTLGPLYPAGAPDLANGERIYADKCQACHGETGLGDGAQGKQLPVPVAALALPETARPASPAGWFKLVSQGNIERYMPPFTSISEKERWDVVAFALSMHTTPEMLAEGKTIFEEKCADCPTAFFTDQQKMAALSEDDLARLIREGGQGVNAFGAGLSDEQVYAVATYLRSLTFAPPPAPTATAAPATPTAAAAGSETPAANVTPQEGTPQAEVTPAANMTAQAGTPQAEVTSAASPAASAGTVTGTIAGQGGVSLAAGTVVTLRGFDHAKDSSGPQETLTLQGSLSSDGGFTFQNVELPGGRILLAEVEYQGVTYQSPFKTVEAGATQVSLDPIPVYETTEDFNTLSLDQMHLAFDFGTAGSVQVFEIYSFSNKTDKAVMLKTDGSQIPFIATPEGAQDVGFEAGQDTASFIPAKDGVAIVPSEKPYSLIAFFTLPYDPKGTEIAQPFIIKADSVSVFVPEGIKLKSQDLADAGKQDISGTNFQMYSAKGVPADSSVTFTLSGTAKTTSTTEQSTNRQPLIIGAAALGLALIGLGVWMYLRDRNMRTAEAGGDEGGDFEDAESVMDAIIALDDLHRARKIPDEAYQVRRAELKEHLKRLENE